MFSSAHDLVIVDFLELYFCSCTSEAWKNNGIESCLAYHCFLLAFKGFLLPRLIGGVVTSVA